MEPRRKGLVQLYIDGEAALRIDRFISVQQGLKPGMHLSDEELRRLIRLSDAQRAQEKALYLLEYRSRSKGELLDRILSDGISREAAEAAIIRLEELDLVNDARFARTYTKMLTEQKKYGRQRVRQGLRQKGISQEIIEEVLAEMELDPETNQENIIAFLEKKYPQMQEDPAVKRRGIAALQRRGFSYEEILSALRRMTED